MKLIQCIIIARGTVIRESASPQSALYTIMYFMISDLDLVIIHVRYFDLKQFNQYNITV